MTFFRDPVWQSIGVIVTLIGILVALIALVNLLLAAIVLIIALLILIVLYSKLRPNKTIFFRVISDTIVLSIKEEETVNSDVQILYKGEEVKEDIHMLLVRLWNVSNEPILPEEYKGNLLRMSFGKEAKVLSAQVFESKPLTIKEEIDDNSLIEFSAGKVGLKPIWLNTDNSLTLKVLLTKFQGEVTVDETRIIVGGYVRDWNKSSYSKTIRLINKYLSEIIIFVCLGMFFVIFTLLSAFIQYFWDFNINAKNTPIWIYFIFIGFIAVIVVSTYYYLMRVAKRIILQIFE